MNIVTPLPPPPTSAAAAPPSIPSRPLGPAFDARKDVELRARAGHQAVYVGDHTVLCRVLGSYMCYVDSRDRALAPHLILNGCWEPWVTIAIARMLKKGMVCVDVGANLGYFTMLMADGVGPQGAVVAFEPNPRLAELCKASMYMNGFHGHTMVSTYATSDRDGDEVHLTFSEHLPMNGTIVASSPDKDAVPVKTVTLDTACSKLERVDLIKIDAEGAEEVIWDGMQQVLERNPHATVVLEWNAQRGQAERLLDKIERRFPVVRHIDFAGDVVEVTHEQLMTERGCEDFMLVLRND